VTIRRLPVPAVYNVATQVRVTAESCGGQVALVSVDSAGEVRRFSYSQLDEFSNRLANRFGASRLGKGDRVAVMLSPSFEAAVAHLAALKSGLIIVPLYTGGTSSFIESRVREAGARLLLLDSRHLSVVEEIAPALHDLEVEVLPIDDGQGFNTGMLETVVEKASNRFDVVRTTPRDPAFLVFTSGSEGKAKGVLHGHGEVLSACSSFGLRSAPPRSGELAWTTADWSWLMGLNIALVAWQAGGSVLVQEEARFNLPGSSNSWPIMG